MFGVLLAASATLASTALLEALLNGARIQAEVLNAGIGNYNASMETAHYLAEGCRYRADLVLRINGDERTSRYDAGWLARESAAYAHVCARVDNCFGC